MKILELKVRPLTGEINTPWEELPVVDTIQTTLTDYYTTQKPNLLYKYDAFEIRANEPGSLQGHYITRSTFLGHLPESYWARADHDYDLSKGT